MRHPVPHQVKVSRDRERRKSSDTFALLLLGRPGTAKHIRIRQAVHFPAKRGQTKILTPQARHAVRIQRQKGKRHGPRRIVDRLDENRRHQIFIQQRRRRVGQRARAMPKRGRRDGIQNVGARRGKHRPSFEPQSSDSHEFEVEPERYERMVLGAPRNVVQPRHRTPGPTPELRLRHPWRLFGCLQEDRERVPCEQEHVGGRCVLQHNI